MDTLPRMDLWGVMRVIHLLSMAFFVGGQLILATVLVPVLRGKDEMKVVARRFGHLSGIALLLLILTGAYMASHYHEWGNWNLRAKIAILIVLFGLIAYHMQNGQKRWLDPVIATLSLSLVVLGVALAH